MNKVCFVSGNFNNLHPGHIRIFKFARELGNKLIVGVNLTDAEYLGALPDLEERVSLLKTVSFIDEVIPLTEGLDHFLQNVKPDIVIKGYEHRFLFNREQSIVDSYGGLLVFSSGSSTSPAGSIDRKEFSHSISDMMNPRKFLSPSGLIDLKSKLNQFANLKVLVIGDVIVDEYAICETVGLSREEPAIVASIEDSETYLGGAGIVSAHASALGSSVELISVLGSDLEADFVEAALAKYGVVSCCYRDVTRHTSVKKRYKASGKTLLRLNRLHSHEISRALSDWIFTQACERLKHVDMLILADFNYGCLASDLAAKLVAAARKNGIFVAADSQSSSQNGDIKKFLGASLIAPTEWEARSSLKDDRSGLPVIYKRLIESCEAAYLFLTMGPNGVLFAPDGSDISRLQTLPAMNTGPVDVSGAGDSFLTAASLGLVSGMNPMQASVLGSLTAAVQVGRLGNLPISRSTIESFL